MARALLALDRGRQTGVLHVVGDARRWRFAVVEGAVRAVAGPRGELLGDALLRAGAMDPAAHREALQGPAREGPIGRWLVSRGLASQQAVDAALYEQMLSAVVMALRAEGLEYRFEPGAADVGMPWLCGPVSTADLVLEAMRRAVGKLGLRRLMRDFPTGELRLSTLGRAVEERANLSQRERAVIALLRDGAHFSAVVTATAGCQRSLVTLAVLGMLRGVVGRDPERASYALLLRKRRQLRERASARALLDLSDTASPDQSRRALRALASKLHPDRLGQDAPPDLRRASNEVLGALIRAERELRAS